MLSHLPLPGNGNLLLSKGVSSRRQRRWPRIPPRRMSFGALNHMEVVIEDGQGGASRRRNLFIY